MARKKASAPVEEKPDLRIRSVKLTFNVELYADGKLSDVKEVPALVLEAQFDQTVGSLAAALLEQANRSPESEAEGEDKKE